MSAEEKLIARRYVTQVRRKEYFVVAYLLREFGAPVQQGLVLFRVEIIPQLLVLFENRALLTGSTIAYHVIVESWFSRVLARNNLSTDDRKYFNSFATDEMNHEYRLTD